MINKPLIIHRLAINEAADAKRWYARWGPELAKRFADAVEAALVAIEKKPDLLALHRINARRYQLKGFPYLVIYIETEHAWLVVAIAHTKRRLSYWKKRLRRT